jgi:hypothetical protein
MATTRFGWCMTQQHEDCIATMTSFDKVHTCSCACHLPAPTPEMLNYRSTE